MPWRRETASLGDLRDREIRLRQEVLGPLDAFLDEVAMGAHPGLGPKTSHEVAWAQIGDRRQFEQAKVFAAAVMDQIEDVLQTAGRQPSLPGCARGPSLGHPSQRARPTSRRHCRGRAIPARLPPLFRSTCAGRAVRRAGPRRFRHATDRNRPSDSRHRPVSSAPNPSESTR